MTFAAEPALLRILASATTQKLGLRFKTHHDVLRKACGWSFPKTEGPGLNIHPGTCYHWGRAVA
jgi:hypothetical protein